MRTRNITSFIYALLICVIIIGAAAVALKPRFTDLGLAYDYVTSQMFRDFSSLTETTVKPDEKIKDPGAEEYKKRLASIDPNVRLDAIKSIEEKSYIQFIPQMIRLLNDNTTIPGPQSSESHQISEAAKKALIKLMKDQITREPGNVALLLPFFQTGFKGSVPEKQGVLKTLSALRDPASYAFLKHLSESHDDPQIASVASRVLDALAPVHHTSTEYLSVTSRRVEFMSLLIVSGIVLMIAAIVGPIKRKGAQFAALCLLAIILDFGLGVLVYAELNRGTLNRKSIQEALNNGDLLTLRTMCYSDNTSYPGDSFFCQEMVKIGGEKAFETLIAIPNLEPDDLEYLKMNYQIRSRWIMSRIIVLNLGKPTIQSIIDKADPDVNLAIAKSLEQLNVQDEEIKRYLGILSSSPVKLVRETAEKALSSLGNRPAWPIF
ncbi:MAG: hypothetical protein P4L38_06475 [Syntrophaceae bacterium]|nr:hypothetical protein [Syntrophaceae bacterium]